MATRWRRLGCLLDRLPETDWARSHLMVPIAEADGDRVLLWFSTRDAEGRSHVTRARVTLPGGEPEFEGRPLLAPGRLGAFDDAGVTASCVVRLAGEVRLYYIGWRRGVTVPFYTGIGCAVSRDGGETFERVSEGPIVPADAVDPFFTTSPWVMRDGAGWRMWYASCVRWDATPAGPHHVYEIRQATSGDGFTWERDGTAALGFAAETEYAQARPCVIRDADRYRMWFSHRGERYAIGYAESADGRDWKRDDARGLEPGPGESMAEYPFVLDHGGDRWLLYNGEGYGATGIMLAVQEDA